MEAPHKGKLSLLLNLNAFHQITRVNGPGVRAALWVQGCPLQCPGCWNKSTWAFENRTLLTVEEVFAKIMAVRSQISGVTFLGGEPFQQAEALAELGRLCQEAGLTVLTYTGYTLEHLRSGAAPAGSAALLACTDTLIDGPFVRRLRREDLVWRGSTNQRIIHLSDRMVADFADEESERFGQGAFEMLINSSGQLGFTQDQPQGVDFGRLALDLASLGVHLTVGESAGAI